MSRRRAPTRSGDLAEVTMITTDVLSATTASAGSTVRRSPPGLNNSAPGFSGAERALAIELANNVRGVKSVQSTGLTL